MNFDEIGDYYLSHAMQDNSIQLLNEGLKFLAINRQMAIKRFQQSANQGNRDARRYLNLFLYAKSQNFEPEIDQSLEEDKRFLYVFGIALLYHPIALLTNNNPKPNESKQIGIGIDYLKKSIDFHYKRAAKSLFDYYFEKQPIKWIPNAISISKLAYTKFGLKRLLYRLLQYFKKKIDQYGEQYTSLLKFGIENNDLYCYRLSAKQDNRYLHTAAEFGDVKSIFRLANTFRNHKTRRNDYLHYLKKAATNGCLLACYDLGFPDVKMNSPEDKLYKGLKLLTLAALNYDPDAQLFLGNFFLDNELDKNHEISLHFFSMLTSRRFLDKKTVIECYWTEYSDDEDIISEADEQNDKYKSSAEEKRLDKQDDYVLSMFNPQYVKEKKPNDQIKPQMTEADIQTLIKIKERIDQILNKKIPNHPYHKKVGVRKVKVFLGDRHVDDKNHFRKSTNEYVRAAHFSLGLLYSKLINWEKKPQEINQDLATQSFKNLEMAYNEGEVEAMTQAGHFYRTGRYTKFRDFQKAFECFNESASKGSLEAKFEIGFLLYHEQLPFQNKTRQDGLSLIQKAADGGYMKAKSFIAKL